jgi:CelD/BcsL family acetyltransferase involved in cellulose biosynthesis
LPETWQGYLAQLSSKERLKVGNRLRRLQNRYAVEFRKCSDKNELTDQLQSLFALHQKRWEARGNVGSFRSEERKQFYRLMSEEFLRQGWLELWALRLNGISVAAQFAFRYRTTVFSLQEGFDPEYCADSVGYVLRSYVLKQLLESGVRRYEFLAGADESKLRWGGEMGRYIHVHIAAPRSVGSLHLWKTRAITGAKAKLRALLPQQIATWITWVERVVYSRGTVGLVPQAKRDDAS